MRCENFLWVLMVAACFPFASDAFPQDPEPKRVSPYEQAMGKFKEEFGQARKAYAAELKSPNVKKLLEDNEEKLVGDVPSDAQAYVDILQDINGVCPSSS